MPPRPIIDSAWYHSKACFNIINFANDLLAVAIFFVGRVDQRFWVPNGSSKVRHYRRDESRETDVEAAQNEIYLPAHYKRNVEGEDSNVSHELTEERNQPENTPQHSKVCIIQVHWLY
ncbi:putative family c-likeg-protein-coupled receptor protein [Penicillium digitatum]|uniref:Uncharacterized protein n=3 Tax=Penicillium digitatum TaxID=36651 RepID=K9GA04_PEND2|nr:hypothetical protein PDIP_39120 [Penicillium digitatum Pd1]EKV15837.1 hypothetical protein PDIP_39120 [Penicillium digitatum Pd1]EKV17902.1 hypothetical protein PDIG_12900 [Penicillium digitatum PHI26]KAG0153700.1 hypothetical protein PDIDSM_2354 [Penicillium digitatum]QQK42296.1 putative family c-likeg-protein-coupled receptor protein [Penicillium digitatum]